MVFYKKFADPGVDSKTRLNWRSFNTVKLTHKLKFKMIILVLHSHFRHFLRLQAEEHPNTDIYLAVHFGKFGFKPLLILFFMSTHMYNFITLYKIFIQKPFIKKGFYFCFFPFSFLIWLTYLYLLLRKHPCKTSE